jgi:hypothetical protein
LAIIQQQLPLSALLIAINSSAFHALLPAWLAHRQHHALNALQTTHFQEAVVSKHAPKDSIPPTTKQSALIQLLTQPEYAQHVLQSV